MVYSFDMATVAANSANKSLEDVHGSVSVTHSKFLRRFFAFAGPAYMVSVGYMDPGNWATDIEGGSRFGYELIWVLLLSNLIAVLLQTLSARMGIVSGRDLAQASREMYPKPVGFALWVLCEIAIAACDLAEVIGTIIGLNLLFGLPLMLGLLVTLCDTFLLLLIQKLGIRTMEAFILMLVFTIGLCFVFEILWAGPSVPGILSGLLPNMQPAFPFVFSQPEALYVAIGIIGATVMPHNLYLHSALVQSRQIPADSDGKKRACKYNLLDSAIALNAAFFVNAAILILSAATFFSHGQVVHEIQEAYQLLPGFLGTKGSSILFAVALLCAGQSSTLTGTLAGQIVMEGFVHLRLRPWFRRLLTRSLAIIPAAIVIGFSGGEKLKDLLILSQVVLSLQLPFAIVPLIQFTSSKKRMGEFATPVWAKILAWGSAAVIIGLNLFLVASVLREWAGESALLASLAFVLAAACGVLLLWLFAQPYIEHKKSHDHPAVDAKNVVQGAAPTFKRIGVALEHSAQDQHPLRHAVALAKSHDAELLLLHVVDGVGGQIYGADAQDSEARADRPYIEQVADELRKTGIPVRVVLRYGAPVAELASAVADEGIDLLIVRSHGHGFFADRVFGATIDKLRHTLQIPILAVR